jgi:ribose transport system substrate-binding protein
MGGVVLLAILAASASTALTAGAAPRSSCPAYDKSVLAPRPIAADLGGSADIVPITSLPASGRTSSSLGTEQSLSPTWYTQLTVTPAQQQAICAKHLTGVYMDWDSVPFNQAIRSGITDVFKALGINLLRITNWSFNPQGFAGDLQAVLALHPNIIMTGGPVSPQQFGAIMAPAFKSGATVTTWGLGSTTLKTGPGEPLKAVVGYDFYNLGVQLGEAIHKAYPNGANVGYIHWVNDSDALHQREQGMLDTLAKYPNIHLITNGTPSPANAASGYTDFNASEAFTLAFLKAHPTVNILFAPWEDPPAIGEAAAIVALHLQNKVHIATMDLGTDGASQLSHDGIISIDIAEDMYDGGRSMAISAALSEIGAQHYPYVIVPTVAADKSNVLDAWNFMHGPEIPCGSSCK